ncbi:secretin N-terminal domain-containing protein [Trichloromonas sp.]|uniref:secretin N-terminal domain-containing protein n=1 Tax=Trichloromonas sp. TaxID=3069249 RepID=UPI003D819608
MNGKLVGHAVVFGLLLALLGGCAGSRAFKEGEAYQRQGKHDQAVASFNEAVSISPKSREYRLNLVKAKSDAAWAHLEKGRTLAARHQYDEALFEFRQSQALDPSLAVAVQEIERTETLVQSEKLIDEADAFYRSRRFGNAKNNLTRALELNPGNRRALELLEKVQQGRNTVIDGFELDVSSETPITLTFKSAKTKEVFNILSQLSGINFIFDEDMKEQSVTLALEKASFAQAMELLLRLNDLGKKVLNSKTIIIYSNTKEKNKQYEDHIIQTFYLSNIDAKKAVNLLRTMLQLRKVYVHEELNALVVRDKPEVIKLAQQILESADRGDSEVVFDLELVEVNHTDALTIGPKLSPYQASLGFAKTSDTTIVSGALSSGTTEVASLVQSLNNLQTFYTVPTVTFDLLKTQSDAEVLSNPKIRVKNKEKAKVHIGSREPVITVTINGDQTSESVQYVDVGVKLDVEPMVHLDNTVDTKLSLEVSTVSNREKSTETGTTVLTLSTTNAQTVLSLKDGEQTIIGGLIRDDSTKGKNTIPFLGDIPLLGKLFTSHSNNKSKREILLSITPHIVKSLAMPNADVASIWSGGEDDLKAGPNFGSFAAFRPELEEPPLAAAPALMPSAPVAAGVAAPAAAQAADLEVEEVEDYDEVVDYVEEDDAVVELQTAVNVGRDLPGPLPPSQPADIPAPVSPAVAPLPAVPAPLSAPVPPAPVQPAERIEQVTMAPPALPQVAQRARIYFSGSGLVNVNKEFVLEAMVDEVADLYSAPLFVRFDPQLLTFVRAEEGEFLRQGGQSTLFTTSVNNDKGELIVGHKQGLGGAGVTGGGKLFRLVFKGRSAGQTQVGFDRVNFRNPAGNRLVVLPMSFTLEVR